MTIYLDEHLHEMCLTEDIMKSAALAKTKAKSISQAFGNANLKQAQKILKSMGSASPEELVAISKRKGKKYYVEAARLARGEKTLPQKLFCVVYCSMKGMQSGLPANSRTALDEALEKLREFARKNAGKLSNEGLTLWILMWFIAFFVYSIPIIGQMVAIGAALGAVMFWFGIFLYVVNIILDSYFAIRGK